MKTLHEIVESLVEGVDCPACVASSSKTNGKLEPRKGGVGLYCTKVEGHKYSVAPGYQYVRRGTDSEGRPLPLEDTEES